MNLQDRKTLVAQAGEVARDAARSVGKPAKHDHFLHNRFPFDLWWANHPLVVAATSRVQAARPNSRFGLTYYRTGKRDPDTNKPMQELRLRSVIVRRAWDSAYTEARQQIRQAEQAEAERVSRAAPKMLETLRHLAEVCVRNADGSLSLGTYEVELIEEAIAATQP
jgi:hypothetical protein